LDFSDFSYRSYVELLRYIRSLGREICPLRDAPADGAYVILRHDIDYSVAKAREMALVEHEEGIRSTYLVLFTSPYYNLLQEENRRLVSDIAGLGHEVGLHFDYDACAATDQDGRAAEFTRFVRLLEAQTGVTVTSTAQHNPSMTSGRLSMSGYRDAYAAEYFREIGYLSDSRRLFGAPDVRAFLRQHARCQLLIHPLWWSHEGVDRRGAFQAVKEAIVAEVDDRLTATEMQFQRDEQRMRRG
jgi:hypothetical protein